MSGYCCDQVKSCFTLICHVDSDIELFCDFGNPGKHLSQLLLVTMEKKVEHNSVNIFFDKITILVHTYLTFSKLAPTSEVHSKQGCD